MLVRLLQKYFGPDFNYCNFYAKPEGCCRVVPCAKPQVTHFSKNHDFDLSVRQVVGQKYIIQYRDFVPSVVSNFELFVRQGNPDTQSSFRSFASAEFARYRGFYNKWVASEFASYQLLVHYDSFLADPAGTLAEVVAWFDPDTAPDPARVEHAIATIDGERVEQTKVTQLRAAGVHSGRDVTEFRHYHPATFKKLAALRLTRKEVEAAHKDVMGVAVPEKKMLQLQTHETPAALRAALEKRVAVTARQARKAAAPHSKQVD